MTGIKANRFARVAAALGISVVVLACVLAVLRALRAGSMPARTPAVPGVIGTTIAQTWLFKDGDQVDFGSMDITTTLTISDADHYQGVRLYGSYDGRGVATATWVISGVASLFEERRFDDRLESQRISIVFAHPPSPIIESEAPIGIGVSRIANELVPMVDVDELRELAHSNVVSRLGTLDILGIVTEGYRVPGDGYSEAHHDIYVDPQGYKLRQDLQFNVPSMARRHEAISVEHGVRLNRGMFRVPSVPDRSARDLWYFLSDTMPAKVEHPAEADSVFTVAQGTRVGDGFIASPAVYMSYAYPATFFDDRVPVTWLVAQEFVASGGRRIVTAFGREDSDGPSGFRQYWPPNWTKTNPVIPGGLYIDAMVIRLQGSIEAQRLVLADGDDLPAQGRPVDLKHLITWIDQNHLRAVAVCTPECGDASDCEAAVNALLAMR